MSNRFGIRALLSFYAFDKQEKDNLRSIVKNLSNFLESLKISRMSISDILDRLQLYNHVDIWIPLMMNMEHGYSGLLVKPVLSFEKQREEMSRLTLENQGRVMPFFAFDPRAAANNDPIKDVRKAIEHQGFVGVKLYPPLGYKPIGNEDEGIETALRALYEYCCRNNGQERIAPIPITAHCSWSGGAFSNKKVKGVWNLNKYYRKMADPLHWRKVLEEYTNLKINLAHFGGLGEWEALTDNKTPRQSWINTIVELVKKYNNVYTDLAFNSLPAIGNASAYKKLVKEKITGIEDKVILGSDWYMSRIQCSLTDYWQGYENLFEEELFRLMTSTNSINFLKSDATSSYFPAFFTSHNTEYKSRYSDIFM